MRKIIKKLKNIYTALKNERAFDKKITDRKKANSQLRDNQESDVHRWKSNDELFKDWNERTDILGRFLAEKSDVLEFGAGNMYLKNSGIAFNSYTPSDIVKRFEETIVCDLNQPLTIDLSKYNAVVLSGVLEYVYDIDNVMKQFSEAGVAQIAVSYCCSDKVLLSRDKNGWLSDFKKAELEQIFANHNYEIVSYSEWRDQSLYYLVLRK